MSLFQHDGYQWRETYFIYLKKEHCPTPEALQGMLNSFGRHYRLTEMRRSDDGGFESLTVISPDDYAAMDITYLDGDEVVQQRDEVLQQLKLSLTSAADQRKLQQLLSTDARFEVYHFEQLVDGEQADDDGDEFFLDPGSLLVVLEGLARLCDGVIVDPQAGALL